jgi:hypothetical protein
MPRILVNLEIPSTVCHALDGLGRHTEPGRTALDILDRGWRGAGPAVVPIYNAAEATMMAAALSEVGLSDRSQRTRSTANRLASGLTQSLGV